MSKTMTFKAISASLILKETPLFFFPNSAPQFQLLGWVLYYSGPQTFWFHGRHIFRALGGGDSLGMIQAHDTYWALYFC